MKICFVCCYNIDLKLQGPQKLTYTSGTETVPAWKNANLVLVDNKVLQANGTASVLHKRRGIFLNGIRVENVDRKWMHLID